MARSHTKDRAGVYNFYLFDVPASGSSDVFTPSVGFSTITAPEIQADVEDINIGNSYFPIKAVKGATLTAMTLSKGVVLGDSDFFYWIRNAIQGKHNTDAGFHPRRNLALVWFHDLIKDTSYASQTLPNGLIARKPVKAFFLGEAIPVRYKTSTDFDASASDRSIQELEIEMSYFDEIMLA